MAAELTVSVVIPSVRFQMLGAIVEALRSQVHQPLEVLVVGPVASAGVQAPAGVRMIDTGRRVGPAAARNRGAAESRGDVICFLDDDCLPEPAWLWHHHRNHTRGERVVGGGVRIPPGSYWRLCDNVASFADFLDCTAPGVRVHLPSLNLSIRRDLLRQTGGFDECFAWPAGEDTDLSFRLRACGERLWFDPAATVTHYAPRLGMADMWRHMRAFGAAYVRVEQRHTALLGASRRVAWSLVRPWMSVLVAPLLGVTDTVEVFRHHRGLRRHWSSIPGVVLGRTAWNLGLTLGHV